MKLACPAVFVFLCVLTVPVRADIIHLRDGKIEGTIIERQEGRVRIRTTTGIVTTIDEKDIQAIEERKTPQEIYRSMAAQLQPDDAEGHYSLAMWCRNHNLKDEMNAELVAAIKADPDHEAARRELGHVKTEGGWLPRDEAMRAQGMVLVDGRWISKEEAEKRALTEEQRQLARAIDVAADKIRTSRKAIADEWEQKLGSIDKPIVASKMIGLLRDRHPAVRRAAATALAKMKHHAAIPELVRVYLTEEPDSVRDAALGALLKLDLERVADTLYQTIAGLRLAAIRNTADQRAAKRSYHRIAVALDAIGDVRSVPFLIAILYPRIEIVGTEPEAIAPITIYRPGGDLDTGTGVTQGVITGGIGEAQPVPNPDKYYFNQAAENALKKLTGQNLGVLPKDWQKWWTERGAQLVREQEAKKRADAGKADQLLDEIEQKRN